MMVKNPLVNDYDLSSLRIGMTGAVRRLSFLRNRAATDDEDSYKGPTCPRGAYNVRSAEKLD